MSKHYFEDRFQLSYKDYNAFGIRDSKYDEYYNSLKNVVDLLNELDEKYIDEFSLRETLQIEVQRLEEENKLLKKSIKRQQSSNNECSKLLEDLNEENQLFREIISQILYEIRMDHTLKEASIMVWVPYSKRQVLEDLFKERNKRRLNEDD